VTGDRGKEKAAILASWDANADAWATVVREGKIPSRAAATDAAIVAAISRYEPGRLLDVGCGEGWLARAAAALEFDVVGVDASARLIELARAAGGADFRIVSYDDIARNHAAAGGPYEVIVLNFALLAEDIVPLLASLKRNLTSEGALLIQTVHPWTACGDAPYRDGWRMETFDAFGGSFPAPMPWYFRTLSSWHTAMGEAGLSVRRVEEPVHPDTGRPLSLLLSCVAR
jgi:2-polyprenyl-3-methyl-5-hydroxy-6-metoxy-1,4-benzoquinol methylase